MNLKHPQSDHVIDVDPDHAQPFLSQGWLEVVEDDSDQDRAKRKRSSSTS